MDLIQHVVTPEKMSYHAFGFITVSGTPEYSILLYVAKIRNIYEQQDDSLIKIGKREDSFLRLPSFSLHTPNPK